MAVKRARKVPSGWRKQKASTADVVGDAAEPPKIPAKWQSHYNKLISLRDQLQREQGRRVEDAQQDTPALTDHMADAGTDSYDRDFALSMISSEQNALFEIEEALNRIKTGRYGICEATAKKIDPQRLEAIPWTRFSAEAERDLEKNNAVDKTRLGELEDLPRTSRPESEQEEEEEP